MTQKACYLDYLTVRNSTEERLQEQVEKKYEAFKALTEVLARLEKASELDNEGERSRHQEELYRELYRALGEAQKACQGGKDDQVLQTEAKDFGIYQDLTIPGAFLKLGNPREGIEQLKNERTLASAPGLKDWAFVRVPERMRALTRDFYAGIVRTQKNLLIRRAWLQSALDAQDQALRARLALRELVEFQITDFQCPLFPVDAPGSSPRARLKTLLQHCVNNREFPTPNALLAVAMAIEPALADALLGSGRVLHASGFTASERRDYAPLQLAHPHKPQTIDSGNFQLLTLIACHIIGSGEVNLQVQLDDQKACAAIKKFVDREQFSYAEFVAAILEHRVTLDEVFQSKTQFWFHSVLESVPPGLRERSRQVQDGLPMHVLRNAVKVTSPRIYRYDSDAF